MPVVRPAARVLVLVLLFVAAAGEAAPQSVPDTKIEKARTVFLLASGNALRQGIHQHCLILLASRFAGPSSSVQSEEIQSILKDELDRALDQSLPVLADQVAVVYAEVFTEGELDAVLTNTTGPPAQSFQAKIPTIADELTNLIAAWSQPLVLGIAEATEERLREKGLVH